MQSKTTALYALVAVLLTACEHVVYYAPSGPGRTMVGPGGAPSIREIKIDSGFKISLWIEGDPSEPALTFFVELHSGNLRLSSSELQFSCQQTQGQDSFNTISASRIVNGTWNVIDVPVQTELVAEGAALSVGGISDGRYWLRTALPQCAGAREMTVRLPAFVRRDARLPTEQIVFRLREGHFVPFAEVM
jgi:hypothetical protein